MDQYQRTNAPGAAPERDMMLAWLQRQRETILCKLDGLDEEQVRQTHAPSSLTLLGLVKHLTDVEQTWFRERFAGEELPGSGSWNAERSWRIEPDDTVPALIAAYRAECAASDRIVRAHGPDDIAARTPPHREGVTLRWILIHMVQETARHVGHADLIRESIDGQTGT